MERDELRKRKRQRKPAEASNPATATGVEALAGERNELPEGWEWRRLGDREVCSLNPRKSEIASLPNDLEVTFVPMAAVDAGKGAITGPQVRMLGDVRKGFTYFAEGDVLFAKITPSMENGKSAMARGLKNGIGFGTTEFHVLRPGSNVIAEWLYQFVRQKSFREEAASYMTGTAGQQRVPAEFLAEVEIPLPPLPEQRRIVAQIEEFARRVEEAWGLRREAVKWVEAVLPAARNTIFEEIANESPSLPLDEVAEVQLGKMLSPKSKTGISPFPYLRNANVQWDRIDLSDLVHMDFDERERKKFALRPGDLLVCEGGEVGRAAIWNGEIENCFYQKALHRVRVKNGKTISRYLLHHLFWGSTSGGFFDLTTGSTIAHLTMEKLKSYRIICPPLDEQRRIVAYLDSLQAKAEAIRATQVETTKELDALMPSVLAKAFRGEI